MKSAEKRREAVVWLARKHGLTVRRHQHGQIFHVQVTANDGTRLIVTFIQSDSDNQSSVQASLQSPGLPDHALRANDIRWTIIMMGVKCNE